VSRKKLKLRVIILCSFIVINCRKLAELVRIIIPTCNIVLQLTYFNILILYRHCVKIIRTLNRTSASIAFRVDQSQLHSAAAAVGSTSVLSLQYNDIVLYIYYFYCSLSSHGTDNQS